VFLGRRNRKEGGRFAEYGVARNAFVVPAPAGTQGAPKAEQRTRLMGGLRTPRNRSVAVAGILRKEV
jgi:hypothetical protein